MAKTVFSLKSEGKSTNVFEILDTAGALTVLLDGKQLLAEQQAAVTPPSGGTTVDAEARTAINTIITRLQAHGLIA